MRGKPLPEWQRQSIVRALVMGDLTISEIASECGVDPWTVRKVRREMDKEAVACEPGSRRSSATAA